MKSREETPRMDISVLEDMRRRSQLKDEIGRMIEVLENQIRQRRHHTHRRFIDQLAAKVGINPQDIIEEGRRRNKVEQRILSKGYESIRSKAKKLVQEELQHRRNVRARYLELYGGQKKTPVDDPELKFCQPVSGGHWTEVELDPPGGMVGGSECHDPVFSEHSYSDDMTVGWLPPDYQLHHFYPRLFVSTGDDDSGVWIRIRQNLTLRHDPLEHGVGNFLVDRLRVNLSGVGYSERRAGEGCPILLDTHGLFGAQYVNLKVKIFQTIESGFLEATLLHKDIYTVSSSNVIEPIGIELGTDTVNPNFLLYNPDNGGSEPWVLVTLEFFASAYDEGGRAEIDFSSPVSDGLELGCVSLFGDYL
jgi:hypothetical protein